MNITVPDFVDYPEFYDVNDNKSIFDGVFVYVIESYNLEGFSLYIGLRNEFTVCRLSDFDSNEIDKHNLNNYSSEILIWSETIKDVLKSARVYDSLFYFSITDGQILLVDVMLNANKFIGPGMLRDLFGNIIPIQKTIANVVLDDDEISKYKGNFVKPSRFRYLTENGIIRPQYGII